MPPTKTLKSLAVQPKKRFHHTTITIRNQYPGIQEKKFYDKHKKV